mmetsp:Transcript_91541/g.168128  ORF Transcript_91541/g.168128 Transcript_91541/m.168128 type:complete len:218 (-) Transcript_91541:1464-2117(-)
MARGLRTSGILGLEFGRVEKAQYPWHRELSHCQEEGANERDGHHKVKIHKQVRAKLRKALDNRGSNHTLPRVLPKCTGDLACVLYIAELLAQAVAILDGLASSLSEVRHHRVCGIATDGHRPLSPWAPPALHIQVCKKRCAIIQISSLDILFCRCINQLQCERIPFVAVSIAVCGRELLAQTSELWRGILRGWLWVNATCGFADKCKPLLPLAATVS